ncbi:MAG: ATP-binding protein [Acidimicrobiales bacterium]
MPELKNPYRPGASVTPLFLAGRDKEIRRFKATLKSAPEIPANIRITGLRGVGKSVLLKRLEDEAQAEGWLTSRIQLEPRHNSEAGLAQLVRGLAHQADLRTSRVERVREATKNITASARGLITVSWQDIELSFAPTAGTKEKDMSESLFETVGRADDQGYGGYMLMLDEAQVIRDNEQEHPLSLLIAAINRLQEHEVPIGITLCGLPTLRTNLLKARTYSERMFRGEEVTGLPDQQAIEAFVRPLDNTDVVASDDLVERVVNEVEGYPYFVQIWGAELWEAAVQAGLSDFDVPLLDSIEFDIYRRLDMDFYDGRVEALTPAEQDLILSTAECSYPPLRTADIQHLANKSVGNVNVLMGRLADQGVIYRTSKGVYQYTAPKFHDYLVRRAQRP